MKKILLLIAFTLLTTSMYAEKIVATYTLSGTIRNVEAGIDNKGALNVFIQVVGEDSDYVMIRVAGESDINKFRSQLAFCKNKFIEWEQVAKSNKVLDFKKEINMDAKCDSWEEFKSIVSCMLDSIRERHYRKFVKPEDVEVRWDEGKIFIKKGRYFIAHVDITTAFWSDLEVLGKLLSKHSVEEVANIVNELECPYALSSALAE
mgnify:CR=1 FL=1